MTDFGLRGLQRMRWLDELQVASHKTTMEGVAEFEKAVPECKVTYDFPPRPRNYKPGPLPFPTLQ